ncbi:response regulator [Pseudobacteriovorax antillogorgiicola]|uniref:Response regulator receiver domain-containing protein n=1 Tax=Pseudobacteriovorax antillogorgiicola TaxID=1513793 RepID=A0A1Y6BHL0_9BACT|nr:response regulator [Pseudobacteriovorax antillogorgiicola]TCS57268.1 response regulator receiver domain-containing protein [Pseudobacteriovorax antillogorgiicola]SMF03236.1 Response regulator receiver domain-containing protein [Pseudobacteriovorax antillogorgiicola]
MSKILIIDEATPQRSLIKSALEDQGHDVIEANDSPQGLVRAIKISFDYIFCDLNMSGLSGKEFLAKTSHLPSKTFILISENDSQAREECRCLGAADVVLKLADKKVYQDLLS